MPTGELRFQYCPWYMKLWRYRYYIPIPYYAVRAYIWQFYHIEKGEIEEPLPLRVHWGIAKGMAQVAMKWYYTMEEVEKRLFGEDNGKES